MKKVDIKTIFCIALPMLLLGCSDSKTKIEPEPDKCLPFDSSTFTGNHYIASYGQSLSRGTRALPIISNSQPYNNLTFFSGVLSLGEDTGADLTSFKPLIEEEKGIEGETPVSGALNYLSELIKNDECVSMGFETLAFIGSAPGKGASTIADLGSGTTHWSYLTEHIVAAHNISEQDGVAAKTSAMLWSQGESDYRDDTTRAMYSEKLASLYTDFIQLSREQNSSEQPQLLLYQVAAHRRYQKDDFQIALAQWDAAKSNSGISLVTPMYHLEYDPDNLHLNNVGSEMLGRYYAKVLKITKYSAKTQNWTPLSPKDVVWHDNKIEIKLHVPFGKIQIDTETVAEAPNYGFDIWQDGALLDIIETVSVADEQTIILTLNRSLNDDDYSLTYAKGRPGDPYVVNNQQGPRGNFRDNDGDNYTYTDVNGEPRRLDNYLIMFEDNKPRN